VYGGGGGYEVLGLRQINTCRKVPLQINFLDDDILHCLLWVLSFYACTSSISLYLSISPLPRSVGHLCQIAVSRTQGGNNPCLHCPHDSEKIVKYPLSRPPYIYTSILIIYLETYEGEDGGEINKGCWYDSTLHILLLRLLTKGERWHEKLKVCHEISQNKKFQFSHEISCLNTRWSIFWEVKFLEKRFGYCPFSKFCKICWLLSINLLKSAELTRNSWQPGCISG
jgi:hypothetical protein